MRNDDYTTLDRHLRDTSVYWEAETEWLVLASDGIRLDRGVLRGVYVDPLSIKSWADAIPNEASRLQAILKYRL